MEEVKKSEIEKLAELARIELSEDEARSLQSDISGILSYVRQVQEVKTDLVDEKPAGIYAELKNKFREDENPHPAEAYSEDILNGAPQREGNYIRVKKIL